MKRQNSNWESDFILSRLVNQTTTAEGSTLPLRVSGSSRVPVVRNLKLLRTQAFFHNTQFTLAWEDPEDVIGISHYNVYVFGLLSNNQQPIQPTSVTSSPAEIRVSAPFPVTCTFRVQTVLNNGQVSELDSSPTVAGVTSGTTLETEDFGDNTIPTDALIGGGDFVTGATSLTTNNFIPRVTGTGEIGPGTVILHVTGAAVGDEVSRIESVAAGDDPVEKLYQNKVTTTNATVTTLHTLAIPASTTLLAVGYVVARRTGGTAGTAEDGAAFKIQAVFKNVAGTATQIASGSAIVIGEDQTTWDVTLTPSSGNILIQVTGALDNNISWVLTLRTYPISS